MVNCPTSSSLHADANALAVLPRLAESDVATFERNTPDYLQSNDPEIGHQLRVAVRRLRALLWAYRGLLPEELADDWRRRLGEVATQIGPPRNWDIVIDVLLRAAVPPSHPSALVLLEALEDIRQRARDESRQTFGRSEPDRLMASFSEAIQQAVREPPDRREALGKFARASVAAASKRLDKALARATNGGLKELHRTRIQIKRLRYLLEFFSPVLAREERKRIRQLVQLQEALGELNDVVVGATYLAQVPVSPEYAAALEVFIQWLQEEKKTRRRAAVSALSSLSRER